MDKKRLEILMIEDNPADVRIIQEMLGEEQGIICTVKTVSRLETGLKHLSEKEFDVLLLDLALPDSRGLETFRRVTSKAPDIPVIILTGNEDESIAIEALKEGAQDYILKGQVFSDLLIRSIHYSIERNLSLKAVTRAKEEWEQTFDTIPDLIMVLDEHNIITEINRAAIEKLGIQREDLIGRFCYEVIHGTDAPPSYCPHRKASEEGRECIGEVYEENLKGHYVFSATPFFDENGKIKGVVEVAHDITERKKMEEWLKSASVTDDLTRIFNRRGFFTLAEQQCKIANRIKTEMSLLFLDVNGLKVINDEIGHFAGDQALIDTADILRKTFRDSDIMGRIGGDEFAVLITETSHADTEDIITRNIRENVRLFNEKPNRIYALSLSMGFVRFDPETPCSINDLLTKADALMYEDKKSFRGQGKPSLSFSKKRIFTRYRLSRECRAEIDGESNIEIINISVGGMCLKTLKKKAPESAFSVRILTPDGEVITLQAEVEWMYSIEGIGTKGRTAPSCEMGLKFMELDPRIQDALENAINRFSR